MPGQSRQSRLLIALAVTAIFVVSFHVYEYKTERRRPGYSPIGYRAWTGHRADFGPNYSQIEEGLWMGGYVTAPPPGTQAVLNVCESKDAYQVASQKWDPIRDGPPAPNLDWLRQQVAFIETEREAGHGVYVHCQAGVSRSAMVMTAYLMKDHGWSRDQALTFLQTKRPAVSPNPTFTPLLAAWERSLPATAPATTQAVP